MRFLIVLGVLGLVFAAYYNPLLYLMDEYRWHVEQGIRYHKVREYDKMLEHANKALSARDGCEAHVLRAQGFIRIGVYTLAEQELSCIEDSRRYNEFLGWIRTLQGRREAAMSYYQQNADADPGDYYSHANLGLHSLASGDEEKAISHFNQAVANEKSWPREKEIIGAGPIERKELMSWVHAGLSDIYRDQGDSWQSRLEMLRAVTLSPTYDWFGNHI
jgi:tetratricopeptide (TPR) repeat protein